MRVVFDTNVVASASFWHGTPFDCVAAWAKGRREASVSPELLAEYHETIEDFVWNIPGENLLRGRTRWPSPRHWFSQPNARTAQFPTLMTR